MRPLHRFGLVGAGFGLALPGLLGCGGADAPPATPVPETKPVAEAATPAPPPAETSAPAPSAAAAPPDPGLPPVSTTRKGMIVKLLKNTDVAILQVADAAGVVCGQPLPKPLGAKALEIKIQWLRGIYDVPKAGQIRFDTVAKGGIWQGLAATKGLLELRTAPKKVGEVGRLHVQAERPGVSIDEEIEVLVCVPVELPKGK